MTLAWTLGDDGGSALTSHQYRQQAAGGSYGAWTAIPTSGAGESNATRYTVTGLTNGTAYTFQVRAVNEVGASAESNTASATPAVPPVAGPPPNRQPSFSSAASQAVGAPQWTAGTSIVVFTVPAATGGNEPLTYTATGLPAGVTLSTTGVFSGTPTTSGSGTATVTVQDVDGDRATFTFPWTVEADQQPHFGRGASQAVGAPQWTAGTSIVVFTVPAATGGNEPLTYTATGLPAGVTLSTTGVFSGTPTTSGSGTATVTVQDVDGDRATFTFPWTVEADQQPHFGRGASQAVGAPQWTAGTSIVVFTVPAATGGDGALTYTATGLPPGVSLSATGVVSGTPTAAGSGTATVTVQDADGDPATLRFAWTVKADLRPSFGQATVGVQQWTTGTPIAALTLPAATGGDGALRYTATSLPPGVSLAAARVVSGTPTTAGSGTATVTVQDADGDPATLRFAWTVTTPVDAETLARTRRVNQSLLPRVGQAVVAGTLDAVTGRVARLGRASSEGLTYQLGGQTTLSAVAVDLGRTLGQAGRLDLAPLLGGSGFALALAPTTGADLGLRDVVLWGQGNYQNLASRGAVGGVTWQGDLLSAQVGVDAQVHPQVLAGVLVNWSQGAFDWQEAAAAGDYDLTMTSVHPYVGWTAADGALEGWGTVGYGWGDLGLQAAGRPDAESEGVLRTAAVGATGRLLGTTELVPGGRTDLRAKGEAAVASLDVAGTGSMAGLTVETRRLRALLEVLHTRALAGGGQVVPSLEVGLRHDAGDGPAGMGLETGVGLQYQYPAWGLTVNGRARLLTLSSAGYDEWGGSVGVQVAPGPNQEGARVQLTTGYGAAASGVQQLWMQEVPAAGPGLGPGAPRVAAEVGYGLALPGGSSVVIPYSGVTWSGPGARQYRVGGRWQWSGQGTVSLEGAQQDQVGGVRDYRVLLEGQWQF